MKTPPPPPVHRDRNASIGALLLAALVLVAMLLLHVALVPRFRDLFIALSDGQRLPTLTAMVLSISRPAAVNTVVLAIALLACKEFGMANKRATMLINIGTIGVALALSAIAGLALYLPMRTLVTNLKP